MVPKFAHIGKACELLGFSRSKLYELAGERKLRLVKVGNRSLVDMEHALNWMATLPEADIASPYRLKAR